MDRKEFIKYNLENIPMSTASRKYLVRDRAFLNNRDCQKKKVVVVTPTQKKKTPRALSDNVTFKNDSGEDPRLLQFSHSKETKVNVSNSSSPTLPMSSESFVRRHSSVNLISFFE